MNIRNKLASLSGKAGKGILSGIISMSPVVCSSGLVGLIESCSPVKNSSVSAPDYNSPFDYINDSNIQKANNFLEEAGLSPLNFYVDEAPNIEGEYGLSGWRFSWDESYFYGVKYLDPGEFNFSGQRNGEINLDYSQTFQNGSGIGKILVRGDNKNNFTIYSVIYTQDEVGASYYATVIEGTKRQNGDLEAEYLSVPIQKVWGGKPLNSAGYIYLDRNGGVTKKKFEGGVKRGDGVAGFVSIDKYMVNSINDILKESGLK